MLLIDSIAWIECAAGCRSLFGVGLIPVQHTAHQRGVFSVQEVHAKEEAAKSSKIARELVLLELEGVGPSDVGTTVSHIGIVKITDPILDGARLLGRIVPDDIAKQMSTVVTLALQYLLLQRGTVSQASETAGTGGSEVAFR